MRKKWGDIKKNGSNHYKTNGGVELIDLYRASGMLRDFAICSIMKYAFRNRDKSRSVNEKDMEKIRHYAEMLEAL